MTGRHEALAARAQRPWPRAWNFGEDGTVVVGALVTVTTAPGKYGPCPVATLRLEQGEEVAVWLSAAALLDAFKRARPKVGDLLAVYRGERRTSAAGREYWSFNVVVDRPDGAIDWDGLEPAEAEPAEPAEGSGDDIPF